MLILEGQSNKFKRCRETDYLDKRRNPTYLLNARYPKLSSRNFINLFIQEIIDLVRHRAQMIHSIYKSFDCIIFQSIYNSVQAGYFNSDENKMPWLC